MRKLFVCVLFLCSLLLSSSASAQNASEADPLPALMDTAEAFYRAKDLGIAADYSVPLSPALGAYVNEKILQKQYATALYGTDKENYIVDLSLRSRTRQENLERFEFPARLSYKYINTTGDFSSGYGELLVLLYDHTSGQLVDLYSPLDPYDVEMRGGTGKALDTDRWEPFAMTEALTAQQAALRARIDAVWQAVRYPMILVEVASVPLVGTFAALLTAAHLGQALTLFIPF